MRTVPVAFRLFWRNFKPKQFRRMHPYLAEEFNLVTDDEPEILFFSCFGSRASNGKFRMPYLLSRAVKVFYSGEDVRPAMHKCHFALSSFRDIESESHFRLPHYVPILDARKIGLAGLVRRPGEGLGAPPEEKEHFCMFAASNAIPYREDFVRKLSKYKQVDCIGPRLNNIGALVPRRLKLEYGRKSKFMIAFENDSVPGYVTEKITDAFQTRSVPIYWGAPDVGLDFRPESFLDRGACSSDQDLVDRIVALDEDDRLYAQMLDQPCLHGNRVPDELSRERIMEFFRGIVDFAFMRSRKTWFVVALGH